MMLRHTSRKKIAHRFFSTNSNPAWVERCVDKTNSIEFGDRIEYTMNVLLNIYIKKSFDDVATNR